MSASKGESQNTSTQNVWGTQQPYLQDLYSQGQGVLDQATQQNNAMMPQLDQAYGNALNPQGNPYLDQQVQGGLGQLQQNFGQTLSQIRGNAVNAGSLGGSRQGVAEGIAARDMGTQANNFVSGMYGQNYQADQNRSMQALQMAPQMAVQQFAPLSGYQQILGAPTVLGQSQGDSKSKSMSGAK